MLFLPKKEKNQRREEAARDLSQTDPIKIDSTGLY